MLYLMFYNNLSKPLAAILICGIIIWGGISCARENDDKEKQTMHMNSFFPDDTDEWKISGQIENYDRDGIFTYIDGAGEVYRMYDFHEVQVRHYEKPDAPKITVEIFDMGKPEDAYGIFLHASQGGTAGIGQDSEFNGGLLTFWQDRYYVSIIPQKLIPESEQAAKKMGNYIAQRIGKSGSRPELVALMPEESRVENSLKYFHLHTSLNYHYYLASENILNLSEKTEAALAIYGPERKYLLIIKYPGVSEAEAALLSFIQGYIPEADREHIYQIEEGNWVAVERDDNFLMLVFDAHSREDCIGLIQDVKNNYIK